MQADLIVLKEKEKKNFSEKINLFNLEGTSYSFLSDHIPRVLCNHFYSSLQLIYFMTGFQFKVQSHQTALIDSQIDADF